jgi:hypothetical protein
VRILILLFCALPALAQTRAVVLVRVLREKLTVRFGNPDHAPELIEIGFRHLRYGAACCR